MEHSEDTLKNSEPKSPHIVCTRFEIPSLLFRSRRKPVFRRLSSLSLSLSLSLSPFLNSKATILYYIEVDFQGLSSCEEIEQKSGEKSAEMRPRPQNVYIWHAECLRSHWLVKRAIIEIHGKI